VLVFPVLTDVRKNVALLEGSQAWPLVLLIKVVGRKE